MRIQKQIIASTLLAFLVVFPPNEANPQDIKNILNTANNVFAPLTVTKEDVVQISREYVHQEDARHNVAKADNPYFMRIIEMLNNLKKVPIETEQPQWDLRIWITPEVNATGYLDGSIRLRSGLMDLLDDEELLAVVGHEVGHVLYDHGLKKYRSFLLGKSFKSVVNLTELRAMTVRDQQLHTFGVSMVKSSYSRELETQADCYGLHLLIYNDLDANSAIRGYQKLSGATKAPGSLTKQLLAQHPSWEGRIENFEQLINEWEQNRTEVPPTPYTACKK